MVGGGGGQVGGWVGTGLVSYRYCKTAISVCGAYVSQQQGLSRGTST